MPLDFSPESLLKYKIDQQLQQQEEDMSSSSMLGLIDQSSSRSSSNDSGSMRFIPPQVLSAARQELMQEVRGVR